jgi:hypothetical protein
MAKSQESSQVQVIGKLEAVTRDVAESTKDIPRPADSYIMLGLLAGAQETLAVVYRQLAAWHAQVKHGVHHGGEHESSVPGDPSWVRAELALQEAARYADAAVDALKRAHLANGVARWYEEIVVDER